MFFGKSGIERLQRSYLRVERIARERPLTLALVFVLLQSAGALVLKFALVVLICIFILVDSAWAHAVTLGSVAVVLVYWRWQGRRHARANGLNPWWGVVYAVVVQMLSLGVPIGYFAWSRFVGSQHIEGWLSWVAFAVFAVAGYATANLFAIGLQRIFPSPFGRSWYYEI